MKYIDVSRTTHTNLDVKQEKRTMIIGISMGLETCQILGQVSHNLLFSKKNLPTNMWSRVRLTRKQLTSRPDHLWPELWKSKGKHAKRKEKQKWSHEKLHLENERKLRGIYFIDPEDKELKETIKNARKKLEASVAPPENLKHRRYIRTGVRAVLIIGFFVFLTNAFVSLMVLLSALFFRASILLFRRINRKPNFVCLYRVEFW